MKKTIAIANQKGGVGKTTTSINLASSIAEQGYNTLLIDFDPQGNSTSGLNIKKEQSLKTIYHGLITEEKLSNLIINTAYKNLDIIPATVDLSGAEVELPNLSNFESILKNKLESVKNNYDFIFIDCPPSLSLLTINALVAANRVIIPLQCEFYALEGMTQLLNTIKFVKAKLNPLLDIEGILPTMYDARNNICRQVLSELQTHFSKYLFKSIIPRNVKLSEAPSFGQPINIYDYHSKGAHHYQLLADELISAAKLAS